MRDCGRGPYAACSSACVARPTAWRVVAPAPSTSASDRAHGGRIVVHRGREPFRGLRYIRRHAAQSAFEGECRDAVGEDENGLLIIVGGAERGAVPQGQHGRWFRKRQLSLEVDSGGLTMKAPRHAHHRNQFRWSDASAVRAVRIHAERGPVLCSYEVEWLQDVVALDVSGPAFCSDRVAGAGLSPRRCGR